MIHIIHTTMKLNIPWEKLKQDTKRLHAYKTQATETCNISILWNKLSGHNFQAMMTSKSSFKHLIKQSDSFIQNQTAIQLTELNGKKKVQLFFKI